MYACMRVSRLQTEVTAMYMGPKWAISCESRRGVTPDVRTQPTMEVALMRMYVHLRNVVV